MSTDLLQFYPTPSSFAKKMWEKFESNDYRLVLEPSAGNGSLLEGAKRKVRQDRIHCIEIDSTRQATLRGKGFQVIDNDFLKHEGGYFYSHILLNPPYNQGAAHVLHALNLLYNGELVALVSAATVRNPRGDAERELAEMIEKHNGSVEYHKGVFLTGEAERVTPVEVALIHLKVRNTFDNPYIQSLTKDEEPGFRPPNRFEIAFPQSRIDDLLRSFSAAVAALREFTLAEDAYLYHRSFFTSSEAPHRSNSRNSVDPKNSITETYNAAYTELRSSAWRQVLNSTEFQRHLSHKAMSRLQADFENISILAFTKNNIHDFLGGLIRDRKKMQLEMMADSFDMVTRHSTNKAFYRSWKSNDKHKTCAYRMKTTRFILPVHTSFFDYPSSGSLDEIRDLERVFALLDGKQDIPEGVLTASTALTPLHHHAPEGTVDHLRDLRGGERLATEYFDIRYYSGAGTCHLFPTRPDLVDRLNREVGKFRNWLPETEPDDSPYWQQYAAADKATAELVKRARKLASNSHTRKEESILWGFHQNPKKLELAIAEVHTDMGISGGVTHEIHQTLAAN